MKKKGNIMGHTEKRSVAEFYRDYETTIENHIGNPDSELFDGVRAILIGNKIKLGQEINNLLGADYEYN